ncbi:MAG TPA: CvpA family protein [Vulgatibacter sp.]
MIVDLGVIALVGVLAAFGGAAGALMQIARLVALIGAAIAAAPLGALLRSLVSRLTGIGEVAAGFWSTSLSFVAVSLVLRWAGGAAARRLTREDDDRAVDRGMGALLGAAKGLCFGWLFALVWLHAERILGRSFGGEGSFVLAATRWIGWLTPG